VTALTANWRGVREGVDRLAMGERISGEDGVPD
jgi:hypothetical protein